MEIGLNNLVTVNGEIIPIEWNTFDPNMIVDAKHEVLMFDKPVTVSGMLGMIGDEIVRADYDGKFTSIEKIGNVEKFESNYKLDLETDETGVYARSFLFLAGGKPWAMCNLSSSVMIKPNIKTTFKFTSVFTVNNNENIASKLWDITVNKFNIKYAAKVVVLDTANVSDKVLVTASTDLYDVPDDSLIASEIKRTGKAITPQYSFDGSKLGVKITATSKFEVAGVKALFIRILWNVGILVYVDSVSWNGNYLNNLTLVRGHQVELKFGLKFTEVK